MSPAEPVAPLAPWITAWPALPALLMVLVGLFLLRRELRPDLRLGGVLVVGLLVRVAWLPIWRHAYDGHEAEYLELWMGTRPLSQGGTLLYPAVQWLYRGLGTLMPHEAAPLALSVAAGLVSIAALYGLVKRLLGPDEALAAAGLLALWGNHAFWSSSAYNIILPHALSLGALWGLALLARRGHPLGAGLLAGGCAALAVATRVESVLVAPVGLVLLLAWRPQRGWLALPGLALGALFGGLAAWYVLFSGQTPGEESRALSFAMNLGLLDYLAPLDQPLVLALALVGSGLACWRAPRLALPLLLLLVGTHLASATFEDYGFRHLLTAQAAACVLVSVLVRWRAGWPALALFAGALGFHTQDIAQRYYVSEEAWAEQLDPQLLRMQVEELPQCTLICEDFRVVPEDQQLSHFNLLDPAEAERLREAGGCLMWLQGLQDHRWSSRAVRDRALRIEHLYATRELAVVEGERGFVGLLVEVGERKPGTVATFRE